MLNLYRDKNRMREPVRDGKIVCGHRQDSNVFIGGSGNLAEENHLLNLIIVHAAAYIFQREDDSRHISTWERC